MEKYKQFRFWCTKVLPLVYDESLSYYEVLCKVVDYINHMIEDMNTNTDAMEELQAEIAEIQYKLDNFDSHILEQWLQDHLAKMIFVEITDDGYIIYYIPDSWQEITFNTSGLDIAIPSVDDNHLVLSY